MPMYQGYQNDERRITFLVMTFVVVLLIGYFLNAYKDSRKGEIGTVIEGLQGKELTYFDSLYGEPLMADSLLYGTGRKHKEYRRFQCKGIANEQSVYYAIWIVDDSLFMGGCFTFLEGEMRAKVVQQLTREQLYK